MKQHITKEMWDELSAAEQEKLSLALPEPGETTMGLDNLGKDYLSWNIGKMIDFLGDDLDLMERGLCCDGSVGWSVTAFSSPMEGKIDGDPVRLSRGFEDKELTNALWSACKEKLRIV